MIIATAMLIDDDSFVRTTLQAGLAHYGIQVSDSLDSASATIKSIPTSNADVAIVDLDLGPGPSGIDVCHTLRTHKPNLGLILLTSYQDPRIFDPSSSNLPKGCRFISKSKLTDFNLLVQTILSERMKPYHSKAEGSSAASPLTITQLEVLKLVAQGLSTDEIAKIREVSPKAIESTIAKIHKTAGLKKSKSMNQRVQLARFYFLLSGKKPPGA